MPAYVAALTAVIAPRNSVSAPRGIKPAAGFTGNHIYVTDGVEKLARPAKIILPAGGFPFCP
jgi:hypothetical protein